MNEPTVNLQKRTWANINLDNVKYNFSVIKSHTNSKICCVVKANAYGHGAIHLAQAYQNMGADYLAVSNIEEALQLRQNGITIPVLILGYTPPGCAPELSKNNITQTVYSYEYAMALLNSAQNSKVKVKIHIKVDTGMGRIGFRDNEEEIRNIVKICSCKEFIPEGIFTHFSVADEGELGASFTKMQFEEFRRIIKILEEYCISFEIKHCANSATLLNYPEYHMDMVRAGIILYGLSPSSFVDISEFRNVMEVISVVSNVKYVKAGASISYGRKYVAEKDMKIATVPIGYADGFWRNNGEEKYRLKLKNQYVPIIGRICMDQLMVDVTGVDCQLGDEILIFGDDNLCSADEIAKINSSINYEVVCSVGERVPRIFVENNKVIGYNDSIYNAISVY